VTSAGENVYVDAEFREPGLMHRLWTAYYRPLLGTVAVLAFLAFWEWAGTSGFANPMFTSSPSRIVKAYVALAASGELAVDCWVSAQEFVSGFVLAIVIGIPLGILMGWYKPIEAVLDPFVSFFYSTPRIALLPVMTIWLGIGMNSKIAIVFLGAVFAVLINTIAGVQNLDHTLLRAARSFGANDLQIFRTIALPGTVPFLLTGIRLGLGHALVGIVAGELYAAQAGVGYLIAVAGNTFQMDKVFAGVVLIAGAGMAITEAFRRLENHYQSWKPNIHS
jgi:ABC-type nitrate/sulfonate/bicarbonate transport system permease component